MRYRRAYISGGSWFFTVVTERRRPLLREAATVGVLREAFRVVKARRPFQIDAVVVLPDHLHCIWSLPPGDTDYPTRWRLIKTWFTKHCDPALRGALDPARVRRAEQALWQHRYWEHQLQDAEDVARHVEYIHYNPVKHGYVCSPWDWPFSSFRRYVAAGLYAPDWGRGVMFEQTVGKE